RGGGGEEVLVEGGEEEDVVIGQELGITLQGQVEAAERGAAVTRDQRRGADAPPGVGAMLIEGQPNQRLDAGQEDRALFQTILGVEREGLVARHALPAGRGRGRCPAPAEGRTRARLNGG